jgi:hypothetical protein
MAVHCVNMAGDTCTCHGRRQLHTECKKLIPLCEHGSFEAIGCVGEVGLVEHENFDKYEMRIRVKFRAEEELQTLSSHRQVRYISVTPLVHGCKMRYISVTPLVHGCKMRYICVTPLLHGYKMLYICVTPLIHGYKMRYICVTLQVHGGKRRYICVTPLVHMHYVYALRICMHYVYVCTTYMYALHTLCSIIFYV